MSIHIINTRLVSQSIKFNMNIIYILFSVIICIIYGHFRGSNQVEINSATEKHDTTNFLNYCGINDTFSNVLYNIESIRLFTENFSRLKAGLDLLTFPSDKMNLVFLMGITGSGKTTLTQILVSDNSKIFSVPADEFSSSFIIRDNNKIGSNTVTSKTLYPDLMFDKESNITICDNPGFEDTRSPVHELITIYGMKKVLQNTKKIKIALVIDHGSLKIGGSRYEFIDALKNIIHFFPEINKFNKSIYVIGNKVESTFVISQGNPVLVSDEIVLNGIVSFLKEIQLIVKTNNTQMDKTVSNEKEYGQKLKDVLEYLIENNSDSYSTIGIMRKPIDEGPLTEFDEIQQSRKNIRNMLFNSENMVNLQNINLGFPLSTNGHLFLYKLYDDINNYIKNISDDISKYLINHYKYMINNNYDINTATIKSNTTNLINSFKMLQELNIDIKSFSTRMGESKNIREYLDLVKYYSNKNRWQFEISTCALDNLSKLDQYLNDLESVSNFNKYSPLTWNSSMMETFEFYNNKIEQYKLLIDVLNLYSSYEYQKINKIKETKTNETNFFTFLEEHNLLKRYGNSQIDEDVVSNLNSILLVFMNNKIDVRCLNNSMTVTGNFILLSNVKFNCPNYNKFIFIAQHTIFIDIDLTDKMFFGKTIFIISPVWEVIGSRVISVDGLNYRYQPKLPKARNSKIGINGNNGGSAGEFFGLYMSIKSGNNLLISACGGDGQDGQDGGDGEDGTTGSNGFSHYAYVKDRYSRGYYPSVYTVVKFAEGTFGRLPEDGGEGGFGGYGGNRGLVFIQNLSEIPHNIRVEIKDGKNGIKGLNGKPGQPSRRGCSLEIRDVTEYYLFSSKNYKNTEYFDCYRRSTPGMLRKNYNYPVHNTISIPNEMPYSFKYNISKLLNDIFLLNYFKFDYKIIPDGIIETFMNKTKQNILSKDLKLTQVV